MPSFARRSRLLASTRESAVAELSDMSLLTKIISLLVYLGLSSFKVSMASARATLSPLRNEIEGGSVRLSILITAAESVKTTQSPAAPQLKKHEYSSGGY